MFDNACRDVNGFVSVIVGIVYNGVIVCTRVVFDNACRDVNCFVSVVLGMSCNWVFTWVLCGIVRFLVNILWWSSVLASILGMCAMLSYAGAYFRHFVQDTVFVHGFTVCF